jgi:hypothetical protein
MFLISKRKDDGDDKDLNCIVSIPSLEILPIEILQLIFELSGNPNLPFVSFSFFSISTSIVVRSKWLINKYGPGK